jgi:hypothetical protein
VSREHVRSYFEEIGNWMRADIQPEIDLARPSEKWPSPKRSGLDEKHIA